MAATSQARFGRCGTVEDVCKFLASRQLPEETIQKFRAEKVDGRVVAMMTEDQVKELGLAAMGDRLRLREVCKKEVQSIQSHFGVESPSHFGVESPSGVSCGQQRLQRRREILNMLRESAQPALSGRRFESAARNGRPKKLTRACTFGVRLNSGRTHADGDRIGICVKSPLGDKNNISLQVPVEDDYCQLVTLVTQVLFPNGHNSVIGDLDNFSTEIVNPRNQNVKECMTGPFTLQEYITLKKVPGTPKFHLFCSDLEDDDDLIDASHAIQSASATEAQVPTNTLTETHLPGTPSGEVLLRIPEDRVPEDSDSCAEEVRLMADDNQPKWATVSDCIRDTIQETEHTSDPVEVLKYFQTVVHQGRALEVTSESETTEGDTLAIFVSRYNLFESGMDELIGAENPNYRLPLEVTFYGELAQDLGGPRREFLTLITKELLKEEHNIFRKVDEGYLSEETSQNLRKKYYFGAGLLAGISMLQQGPLPSFMEPNQLDRIMEGKTLSLSEEQFREGLNCLGFVDLIQRKPCLQFLLRSTAEKEVNHKQLLHLLQPQFSEAGSNARLSEEHTYRCFVLYLKEVAAGRRGSITLGSVLRFVTGAEREPILGFQNQPSIQFSKWLPMSLPRAQTCSLQLSLPVGPDVPTEKGKFFEILDLAFANSFFGVM